MGRGGWGLLVFFCSGDADRGPPRAVHILLIQGPQEGICILRTFQSSCPIRGIPKLRSEVCSISKRRLEHMLCPNKVNTCIHPGDLTFQFMVLRALVDVGIHKNPSVGYARCKMLMGKYTHPLYTHHTHTDTSHTHTSHHTRTPHIPSHTHIHHITHRHAHTGLGSP